MKCVYGCDKDAEYVYQGYSLCEKCFKIEQAPLEAVLATADAIRLDSSVGKDS